MVEARELQGYYGRSRRPCILFEYNGWYCVEGCTNVNHSSCDLDDGVDVESLCDDDFFTADMPVICTEDLEREVNDFYGRGV
jgi:hypothetical protein